MYAVSNEYRTAIAKPLITDRISGTITLADGTALTISDKTLVKNSLKISHELCGDYRIGTFNLGCLQIAFFDDNALLRDFTDAKICPVYQIKTEAGWESVPMGIYLADGNSTRRKRNTVSLTAYDGGSFFDKVIPDERKTQSGTAEELISAACADCGVTLGAVAAGLPNTAVTVSAENRQIQTYRDLIAWCAALLCGYAVIDREGKLRILPAKYSVSSDDSSVILTDKILTAAERDSIYVTDTRAYIKTLHAYCGGTLKTYLSDTVQPDEQAAAATYTLSENPLLPQSLDEETRDQIHTDWLHCIDGFKQRGITAEIFGDPALDVGDVLRCSGGDIDQRRSIVGLVTKQEWRYRNLHTVICAAPQLSGKTAERSAVAESQTGKRLNALSSPSYTAGTGIEIKSGEISLKPAQTGRYFDNDWNGWRDYRGGIFIDKATWGSADGLWVSDKGALKLLPADYGVSKPGRIEGATGYGGVSIGKGIATTDKGHISVNLGDGMRFNQPLQEEPQYESNWSISPKLGDGLVFNGGDNAVRLNLGKGFEFGAREYEKDEDGNDDPTRYISEVNLKLGKGLRFGENGELTAEGGAYKAGENISISEDGAISAQVKEYKAGENITISEDGTINAEMPESPESGVAIDQAVIIKEADAEYLLHNFTQVEYNAGNKIVYAGPGNQIVVQGYLAYTAAALNAGANYVSGSYIRYPADWTTNISRYMEFAGDFYYGNIHYKRAYFVQTVTTTSSASYNFYLEKEDGTTERIYQTNYFVTNQDHWSGFGLAPEWLNLYPPGSVNNGVTFENGYAMARFNYFWKSNFSQDYVYERWYINSVYIFPFASLAEYQAAVGLTYEPLTLTRVEDNPTTVSGSEVN